MFFYVPSQVPLFLSDKLKETKETKTNLTNANRRIFLNLFLTTDSSLYSR